MQNTDVKSVLTNANIVMIMPKIDESFSQVYKYIIFWSQNHI